MGVSAVAPSQDVTTSVKVSGEGAAANTAPSTDPQFGTILKQMQARYGERAEKPREIKKTLDKDDFLKIMITQMKHQDPTNPFKAEQMAAEMAQFTTVEQMHNMNQNLAKLTQQNQPLERMAMTHLIGKWVTVDRDRFTHNEGSREVVPMDLPKDAAQVHIQIINELGEPVYEKDLGPQKAGQSSVDWDGYKGNTPLPAKSGSYALKIDAKDGQGQPIAIQPQAKAQVLGVSYEGTEPVLLIGDMKNPGKISMKNVIRVEDGNIAKSAVPAPAARASAEAPNQPNLFAFQKGVGSKPIESHPIPQEALQAIQKFQQEQQGDAQDQQKGFPNGLKGGD